MTPGPASAPGGSAGGGDVLAEAREIVLRELQGRSVRVFLFGSRARGTPRNASDIDIALLGAAPLPPEVLSNVREALEESSIPFEADVIDLATVDADFRRAVLAESITWSD